MPWCIREQRAICTKNGPHFEREHRRCQERGEQHYGVLVVGEWTTDEIFWSLRQYLASDLEPPVNQVIFLSKAAPAFIQRESGT
jgi:hypothetical protein